MPCLSQAGLTGPNARSQPARSRRTQRPISARQVSQDTMPCLSLTGLTDTMPCLSQTGLAGHNALSQLDWSHRTQYTVSAKQASQDTMQCPVSARKVSQDIMSCLSWRGLTKHNAIPQLERSPKGLVTCPSGQVLQGSIL
jgi:hypothetical protein